MSFGPVIDTHKLPPTEKQKITAWSFSRWQKWVTCPRSAYYAFVQRLPEPKSDAMQRGTDAHAEAASILTGEEIIPDILKPDWVGKLHAIREDSGGDIEAELQMAFTQKWEQTEWFGKAAWCRVILDGLVMRPEGADVVIHEHKTGKRRDSHYTQATLYAAAASVLAPDREVRVQFNYLDEPAASGTKVEFFPIETAAKAKVAWTTRVEPMLNDTIYPTRTGPLCRWCHYRKSNGGPCEKG